MSDSYRALANDFYVNLKLGVRMDLPSSRETTLELFERIRREFPSMVNFRRYREELALESDPGAVPYRWLALRSSHIRSGVVNPSGPSEAYPLHRLVLEVTPYYLTISPLDIEYVELLFGFDMPAPASHDGIVFNAMVSGSPLADLADGGIEGGANAGVAVTDCQPVLGLRFRSEDDGAEVEAQFEVKTRTPSGDGDRAGEDEPISVYLTVRRVGAVPDLKALPSVLSALGQRAERLVEDRVIPHLLVPIRDAISSGLS